MKYRALVTAAIVVAGGAALAEYTGSYVVPLDHEAIAYAKLPVADPVVKLNEKLAKGEVQLEFEEGPGYLRSALTALHVPAESQILVFSKTSFQASRISPGTPRALYFNDSVSVGYVRGGDVIELIAVDPKQGAIFYTLDQDSATKPRFERRDSACLQCHASGTTAGVPGLLIRSVYPEPTGMPVFQAGSFITDHRSPFSKRWGGWYVTGTHGAQQHMGNAFVRDRSTPDRLDLEGSQNVTDLSGRFDPDSYLTTHSDIVALMTIEHQSRLSNIFTRLGYETRMAMHTGRELNRILGRPEDHLSESSERRIMSGVNEVVAYMLFADEAKLTEQVRGTSGFEKVFSAADPRDPQGRSLRDFDLKTRMFRYPLSYMIYSDAFDSLPAPALERVYSRLYEVLTEADTSDKFAHLSSEDRKSILEILRATKKTLPHYFYE